MVVRRDSSRRREGKHINPSSWAMPFVAIWAVLYCIVLLRAGGTYALGRLTRRGITRFNRIRISLESPRFRKMERALNRWGAPVVALSFLTIGFQTLANLAAGTTRMSLRRYLPALAVGGAAWATVYSSVGFIGFEAFVFAYSKAPVASVVGVAIFAALLLALLFVRRPARLSSGKPAQ